MGQAEIKSEKLLPGSPMLVQRYKDLDHILLLYLAIIKGAGSEAKQLRHKPLNTTPAPSFLPTLEMLQLE